MIPERITQKYIESQIESTEYFFDESEAKKWCTCIATLKNGFKVGGISYRQFSIPHCEETARSAAYSKVIDKLWEYFAFTSHYEKYEINE